MPAKVIKRGNKFRVIEADTGKLVRRKGTPVDGGGHASRDKAQRQSNAVNARGKFKNPPRPGTEAAKKRK